jgi:hypothetical protein
MVGAYQRGEAVSLTLVGVRETRFAAARDSSSRALADLAGLPERSGCFFFDDEFFFETFSELLSASSFVDFFSKATLGLLTAGGRRFEATAIHLVLA